MQSKLADLHSALATRQLASIARIHVMIFMHVNFQATSYSFHVREHFNDAKFLHFGFVMKIKFFKSVTMPHLSSCSHEER